MIRNINLRRFKCFENHNTDISSDGVKILAGENNSGKSTLLQSLAVWHFAILALKQEKGDVAVIKPSKNGFGVSLNNFPAVNLPDFKHMWYNNKSRYKGEDQYSLSISVDWEYHDGNTYNVKLSFQLKEDRIFVRVDKSTIDSCDVLPKIMYLPSIAGIDADEKFAPTAIQNRMRGRGLAGSVLRNVLLDLNMRSKEYLEELKSSTDYSKKYIEELRKNHPWEKLQSKLQDRFGMKIEMDEYNEAYHATVQAYRRSYKRRESGAYQKVGSKRDLMNEGTGVLQWICVFAHAVDPQTDVLLLDEPDAHLHGNLQTRIVGELERLIRADRKQILISTHSTKILKKISPNNVVSLAGKNATELSNSNKLIKLIKNLGGDVDRGMIAQRIEEKRKVLFVEGITDEEMIIELAKKMGKSISNVAIIHSTEPHKNRKKIIDFFKEYYPEIQAISLRDRDEYDLNNICKETLRDKGVRSDNRTFMPRTLRRRTVENYALVPECIARTISARLNNLEIWWNSQIDLPHMKYALKDTKKALHSDVKDILCNKLRAHNRELLDVWGNMSLEEVHDDLINIINQIHDLSLS